MNEYQDENVNIIQRCDRLNRLIHALKYYHLSNISNESVNDGVFVDFCVDIYEEALNDWTHFIDHHSDQLQHINEQLINDENFGECNIKKCAVFKRHHDQRRMHLVNNDREKLDGIGKNVFFGELFDNIHHYLFHLYQTGMRAKMHIASHDEVKDDDGDRKHDEYKCIDHEFARKRKEIATKSNEMGVQMNRFSDNNNKYNIKVIDDIVVGDGDNNKTFMGSFFEKMKSIGIEIDDVVIDDVDEVDDNETFMDSFFEILRSFGMQIANKLYALISEGLYETDALIQDVDDGKNGSNIIGTIKDVRFGDSIREYIKLSKCMFIFFLSLCFVIYNIETKT